MALICLCGTAVVIGQLTGLGTAQINGTRVLDYAPAIGGGAYLWRAENRYLRSVRPRRAKLAEPPEELPVIFRSDGQSIVVYPARRNLALHALFAGGVALVCAGLAYLLRGVGPIVIPQLGLIPIGPVFVLGFGVLAVICLLGLVPDLVRLLHRCPALIVNSDGITDLASARLIGFGLIPWHEIAGFVTWGGGRGVTSLQILPVSRPRLLRRRPAFKRFFLHLSSLLGIYILSVDLSEPPDELYRQIDMFVTSHAPTGYLEAVGYDAETNRIEQEK